MGRITSIPIKLLLCGLALLQACGQSSTPKGPSADTLKPVPQPVSGDSSQMKVVQADTSDYAVFYVTVADTGLNYYTLHKTMELLQKELKWPVDTMGRYYNPSKNKIVLSDTDEDEIYRGDYYPRRGASGTLSLEYYALYNDTTTEHTIAVVAGIYETKASADSALGIVRKKVSTAFVVRSSMYMGCLH